MEPSMIPNKSVVGINNIELISDRSLQTNLDEIRQLREEWPDRVIIGSLMATMTKDAWVDLSLKLWKLAARAWSSTLAALMGCASVAWVRPLVRSLVWWNRPPAGWWMPLTSQFW
jgi:hypothetical protein